MAPFQEDDFPLRAIGNRVYRRTESSPICTAVDDEMAYQIAKRLNRDNQVNPDLSPQDDPEYQHLINGHYARIHMTREQRTKERIDKLVTAGDVAGLRRIDEPGPCACLGCQDDEPQCVCVMNRRQLRMTISVPALRRGEIKRIKT